MHVSILNRQARFVCVCVSLQDVCVALPVNKKMATLGSTSALLGVRRRRKTFPFVCLLVVTVCSLPSGAGSGVPLASGGPGAGRRRGLPRVSLHRIRERTHQEASRQPRRLHTDQSAAGLLPGKGGEEKNQRWPVSHSGSRRNSGPHI